MPKNPPRRSYHLSLGNSSRGPTSLGGIQLNEHELRLARLSAECHGRAIALLAKVSEIQAQRDAALSYIRVGWDMQISAAATQYREAVANGNDMALQVIASVRDREAKRA